MTPMFFDTIQDLQLYQELAKRYQGPELEAEYERRRQETTRLRFALMRAKQGHQ